MIEIFLIGQTSMKLENLNAFLRAIGKEQYQCQGTPEEIVEACGRICMMSFGNKHTPDQTGKFIRELIRNDCGNVLEHTSWTFLVKGVSRAFTHQLVRHRIGFSFSQRSQQYCDESMMRLIMPRIVQDNPEARKLWELQVESQRQTYRKLCDLLSQNSDAKFNGMAKTELKRMWRSAARSILPQATETIIAFTANARALRHFLSLRGATSGDEEMRNFSAELLRILKAENPVFFQDFQEVTADDGMPLVVRDPSLLD